MDVSQLSSELASEYSLPPWLCPFQIQIKEVSLAEFPAHYGKQGHRSEERRVGTECVP